LRKGTITFAMSIRLSVLMEQLGSHWTDFYGIWNTSIFRKPVAKFQVSVTSDKNNGYFTWRPLHTLIISRSVLLRIKMCHTKVVEKIKTHILCSITFFRKSCRWWDMWKNTAQPGRPQMTMWRMCIACWVPKPTNIHSEYVILIDFPHQQWFHERASMLRYIYFACLAFLYIFHPCIVYNQFATPNHENAQYNYLNIYTIMSHWIFLHVPIHKESSSGNQTTATQHKTKLATFTHSWHGVKESTS